MIPTMGESSPPLNEESRIKKFYHGKNIFITGATGFLGMALIEKIFRDLPNIGNLYLLMRSKKGKNVKDRLEDIKKNAIFETLLQTTTKEIFNKMIPIEGDVGNPALGISAEDRNTLINNVNVVIHSAATLDFHEPIRSTVNINLLGTRNVLELCDEIKNLEALVHVSSAYVNSFKLETEEILYPTKMDAEALIKTMEVIRDDDEEVEKALIQDHPNTYTFTKHLAEHEVNKHASKYPCGIVRPSMITAAWKAPVPGWTNSKNGPQGFFMGASKGVVRRLPVATSLIYDYIPIDIVVNQVLVTGQYVNSLKEKSPNAPLELTIFHCTSSTYKPFRWDAVKDKVNSQLHKYPLMSAYWYPHLKFMDSLLLFKISALFIHFLPAVFLDLLCILTGNKTVLVRLHRNVWKSLNRLEKFIFTEWKFDNTKTLALAKSMTAYDKKVFGIDIGELRWEDYFEKMMIGVRRYLSRENPSNLDKARKKDKFLLALHCLLQIGIYAMIWTLTSSIFNISSSKAALVVPIAYVLFDLI